MVCQDQTELENQPLHSSRLSMISKIISGGQTGADRAALDAALKVGFPIGGSCPAGRLAEDGPISEAYSLTEISGGYRQRTKQNVLNADGTVIFYRDYMSGGTEATVLFCIKHQKPYKLIDISLMTPESAAKLVVSFCQEFSVGVLNVAGPRASSCPTMYDFVKQVLRLALQQST